MSKSSKSKKDKVQKLSEEEYTAYVSSLRALSEEPNPLLNGRVGMIQRKVEREKEE